jgi:signal transduction histidine kinase
MTREDLTRVLVNLTKNAAEAMPGGGHLQIDLEESAESLSMTFTDGGPGISPEAIETIFTPGYTTRVNVEAEQAGQAPVVAWPLPHRGLGLAIVRSIVAAAGGAAWAANRRDGCGAVLVLEFPLCAACPEVGLASES